MSGELLIKTHSWRQVVPALLLSAAAAAGVTFLSLQYLSLSGFARGAVAAFIAYVLFRVLYPVCAGLFSGSRTAQAGTWRVTPDTLYLNDTAIPRASIRQVHCWPNRDALGHAGAGWTVNIETTGKNHLLRTLTEGEDAERSVRQLRAMVVALGYGDRWDSAAPGADQTPR